MNKTKLMAVGIVMVAVNIGGCSSVVKEVVKQKISENYESKYGTKETEANAQALEEDYQEGEESSFDSEHYGNSSQGGNQNSFSGNYEQFIINELEPHLGTAKNDQFSYGFERINYEGGNGFFASPMTASLNNGIISTYRRDLNKDGKDELLAIYLEGSQQSGDRRNHFCLSVYGDTGNGIIELGKISFDDCFSGYNGEEYLFGLKDMGDKRLIYAGGSGHVWTWADGNSPVIYLYQLENNRISEIFQVSTEGSDDSWMPEWRRQLQGYGFDLQNPNWNECNLEGESGFEVLAYGECYTEDRGTTSLSYGNELQQYWLDNGMIIGGIYGPNTQKVMQMNQSMRPYVGGGQMNPYAGGGQMNPYAGGGQMNPYAGGGQMNPYAGGGQMNPYAGGGQVNPYAGGNSSGFSDYSSEDYILPDSSSRYLTRSDLAGLSQEQLRLARNEIYARHGRKFKTKELQDYFNSKSWYVGTINSDSFKDDYLNIYEKENIRLIQSMEK